jgi:hypothetical protein
MCHVEHVYHQPCCHWGRDRIVDEPCCRSRFVNGHAVACTYAENIGSINSSGLCSDCRYRLASGLTWRPFADSGANLRERMEKRLKQEMEEV